MEQRQLGRLWPVSVLTLGGRRPRPALGRHQPRRVRGHGARSGRRRHHPARPRAALRRRRIRARRQRGLRRPGCRTGCGSRPSACWRTRRRTRSNARCGPRWNRACATCAGTMSTCSSCTRTLAPDGYRHPGESHPLRAPTPWSTYREALRPLLEDLVGEGLVGAWALTGIGLPGTIIDAFADEPAPAAVQCITNLLDSPGALKLYAEPARPRDIIRAAGRHGVGVLGIRAVQAGALTDGFDRDLPEDHPEVADFRRAPAVSRPGARGGRGAGRSRAPLRAVDGRRGDRGARHQEPRRTPGVRGRRGGRAAGARPRGADRFLRALAGC